MSGGQVRLNDRLRLAIGSRPLDRVAREAKVDRQTLRAALRDDQKRGPTLDTIEALARVLLVSPGWLAFGEGKP